MRKRQVVYLFQTDSGNEIYSSMKKAKRALAAELESLLEENELEDLTVEETRISGSEIDISITKMWVY
jgi:hypothetical protein